MGQIDQRKYYNTNFINCIGTPEPIITIVMTTVNRKNETLLTLKSFERHYANRYNINVIIVDDNSNKDHKLNNLYQFLTIN